VDECKPLVDGHEVNMAATATQEGEKEHARVTAGLAALDPHAADSDVVWRCRLKPAFASTE
jgi:hypothetical protein